MLEEEELDDRYFMMRVRSDGALLPAAHRPRPRHRRPGLRPRHRRRHRPREHPVPLDPDRGRPRDLAPARGRRAGHAPRPAATRRGRSSAPPSPASPPTRSSTAPSALEEIKRRFIGDPDVLQPAAEVQDRADRAPEPRRLPRDQRRLVRRHRPPRARPRLRPLGRRRAVHQPDARPEARRLDPARRGRRRLGGRHVGLPRLRLPPAPLAGPAEVPGRRLGRREVPRGARERVPRPGARLQPLTGVPGRATATTSACTSRRTASSTSASRRPPAGCRARCWCSWPT